MFSRTLNTALIEEHYDEVVQLVCSIAERTISPDVVIKRFTSYSRKSGLHQALIEIGRAVECIFTCPLSGRSQAAARKPPQSLSG